MIVKEVGTFSGGSAASLTTSTYTITAINNAGSAFTATVSGHTLVLTPGSSVTTSTYTIKGVNTFTTNTIATLSVSNVSVMGLLGDTIASLPNASGVSF